MIALESMRSVLAASIQYPRHPRRATPGALLV
jgi:hypothetical protein